MFEGTLELNSPISKEDWDKLTDVELEVSDHIWFTTPSGKRVDYVKADVLEQIKTEIASIEIFGHIDKDTAFIRSAEQVKNMALKIIDKHMKGGAE